MERRIITGIKERREARVRSQSCGSLEKMWKKNRVESGEGRGGEEIFRISKKTVRSPEVGKGMGEGIEKMMRKLMRKELGEVMKEIKEVKGWREKINKMREEVKEEVKEGYRNRGIQKQREKLRKDLERMKEEFRE